jgi:3-hydroxyisobutyrate dehydrogenase
MKVGFIGLGLMGQGMSKNLRKAGFELVVNDLFEKAAAPLVERGAVWAATPRELAEQCDVVFTSLPTPADVESVYSSPDGMASGFKKGAVWFDLSTNAVDAVRKMHERVREQGVEFLDAPVSGGPQGAESGKLAIWIGGDHATFLKCKPVLDAMADQARYIGDIGAGAIAKLVHNLASSSLNALLAEVLTVGVKAGLDPLPLWEAIRTGAVGRMRSFDSVSSRFLQGKLDQSTFALRLLHKDVGLGLQLAKEGNVPARLCSMVFQDITEALNRGWGNRDSQAFLLLQQERANVPPFNLSADDIKAVMERN